MSSSGETKEPIGTEVLPEGENAGTPTAAEEQTQAKEEEDGDSDNNNTDDDEENCSVEKDVAQEQDQQGEGGGQEPITVDLSSMKTLYKFRSRPTLPYLLTEYGMEDKDAPVRKQKEKKKKKKQGSFGDDSGRDREKEKQQEEKYLQIINDMTRLRDYYYDEYTTLLQNKVDQQRHDIRQRSRVLQNKLHQQEKTARQESHHMKPRMEHHTCVSNDNFLADIPKSDLFYIVQLQDKLIREGTLKSQSDLDTFWERIQEPDIFYMYFNVPKSDDLTERDFNDNASSRATSTWKGSQSTLKGSAGARDRMLPEVGNKGGLRALSRIAESRETSRPGTRTGHHWAITQQFQSQHREPRENRRSSFTGLNKPPQVQQKSSFLQDLEKRFPKLEMPKLHCFTMNLGPKPPDSEEVRHQQHLRELEKNRKKYTYKLTKMHQLAMANAAAASRILETHEDIEFIINGAPLTDLISDQHFYSGLLPPRSAEEHGPSCSSPLQGTEAPGHPVALASVLEQDEGIYLVQSTAPSHHSAKKSGSRKSKRSGKQSALEEAPPKTPILPLSLGEVKDNSRTVEAKCMSTLWTNYTKEPVSTVGTKGC